MDRNINFRDLPHRGPKASTLAVSPPNLCSTQPSNSEQQHQQPILKNVSRVELDVDGAFSPPRPSFARLPSSPILASTTPAAKNNSLVELGDEFKHSQRTLFSGASSVTSPPPTRYDTFFAHHVYANTDHLTTHDYVAIGYCSVLLLFYWILFRICFFREVQAERRKQKRDGEEQNSEPSDESSDELEECVGEKSGEPTEHRRSETEPFSPLAPATTQTQQLDKRRNQNNSMEPVVVVGGLRDAEDERSRANATRMRHAAASSVETDTSSSTRGLRKKQRGGVLSHVGIHRPPRPSKKQSLPSHFAYQRVSWVRYIWGNATLKILTIQIVRSALMVLASFTSHAVVAGAAVGSKALKPWQGATQLRSLIPFAIIIFTFYHLVIATFSFIALQFLSNCETLDSAALKGAMEERARAQTYGFSLSMHSPLSSSSSYSVREAPRSKASRRKSDAKQSNNMKDKILVSSTTPNTITSNYVNNTSNTGSADRNIMGQRVDGDTRAAGDHSASRTRPSLDNHEAVQEDKEKGPSGQRAVVTFFEATARPSASQQTRRAEEREGDGTEQNPSSRPSLLLEEQQGQRVEEERVSSGRGVGGAGVQRGIGPRLDPPLIASARDDEGYPQHPPAFPYFPSPRSRREKKEEDGEKTDRVDRSEQQPPANSTSNTNAERNALRDQSAQLPPPIPPLLPSHDLPAPPLSRILVPAIEGNGYDSRKSYAIVTLLAIQSASHVRTAWRSLCVGLAAMLWAQSPMFFTICITLVTASMYWNDFGPPPHGDDEDDDATLFGEDAGQVSISEATRRRMIWQAEVFGSGT